MANETNTKKRIESTKQYIDELSNEYSKLNMIRVDIGYKKPYSDDVTLADANRDMKRMFNNMRSKPNVFKDQVGYVLKKEYTKDKGMHYHAIFIFDGQKVQKDKYKADQIGKYWEQVTKEKGSYHNCHRNTYDRNGIGMLDHRDSDKRKILDEDVIPYLCKDVQNIAPVKESKRDRAFTRGTVSKSKGNIGRPRD